MAWNGSGGGRGGNGGGGRAPLQRVEGVVEKVNDNGPKIGGQWFNFSKHASFDVYPDEGDYVIVGVSQGKWINEMEVTEGGQGAPAPRGGSNNGGAQRPQGNAQGQGSPRPATSSIDDKTRQVLIVRQSCIKAASDVFSGSGASSEDVIAMARDFEAYVFSKAAKPAPSNDQDPPKRPDEDDDLEDLPF